MFCFIEGYVFERKLLLYAKQSRNFLLPDAHVADTINFINDKSVLLLTLKSPEERKWENIRKKEKVLPSLSSLW